ncbi:MAG: hypothetical protein JXR90_10135 [Spirochaetes bacterium]|nr:hypothetical protein [Spirochaetota bacterium]
MFKRVMIIILILAGFAVSFLAGVVSSSNQYNSQRIKVFFLESDLREAEARIDSLRSVYER